MDTVFGTYSTDPLKLVNHRARHTGVQHRHHITPVDPNPGEAVTVRVVTRTRDTFTRMSLYYTTDGSTPSGSQGHASNGSVIDFEQSQTEWDPFLWDYVVHWTALIPGQPTDTLVQYAISAWSPDGGELFADSPNVDDAVHHATMVHFGSASNGEQPVDVGHFAGEQVFNYAVDTLRPPAWANDAIIYHILIDRFFPGSGRSWRAPSGPMPIRGGTLWGVLEKLDYIADLGVNCIWLSPTWTSPTYHGYDIVDYDHTEPRIGGDEALRAVVEGAHQRGIRVLLDMVCNHVSNQHPMFDDALRNPDSPYREWFFFDDRLENGYKSFFGVADMPRINLNVPAARDWMIGIAVRWLRDFHIDGYRLDVADGPGPSFWTHFRKACRAANPECLVFGEIIDTPERLRTYAGRLDGCLDFPLADALRRTYALETMSQLELSAFLAANSAHYPSEFIRPIFLDNHDMNRFGFLADQDQTKLKHALEALMRLPGPIVIYYGTEVGLRQTAGVSEQGYEDIRRPMLWGEEQDHELLYMVKALIRDRKLG